MRPDPHELLRLIRISLKGVVTPAVGDEWATYVAKSIERMLDHLERRWTNEIRFLADDTIDLRDLFDMVRPHLGTVDPDVTGEIDRLLGGDSLAANAVTYRDLSAENQEHRGALERLLVDLDANTDADPDGDLRDHIRAYLVRQLARDVELAEPTFMRFGAPTPK